MDDKERARFSLRRWSQRKHAARREAVAPPQDTTVPVAVPPAPTATTTPAASPAAPLPPVESLTFDADFTGFLRPDVDPSLKNAALKKLFADPRFNVMDGLDVYIDDYSKPDPIDAATVASLVQSRYLFDPPKTRVNERGEVEDVPQPTPDARDDARPADATATGGAALASAKPEPLGDAAPVETDVPAASTPPAGERLTSRR